MSVVRLVYHEQKESEHISKVCFKFVFPLVLVVSISKVYLPYYSSVLSEKHRWVHGSQMMAAHV